MSSTTRSWISESDNEEKRGTWRHSQDVCALADQDRQLGHVVKTDAWHAFDAVHPNDKGTGFTYLGAFNERNEAKNAVETAIGRSQSSSQVRRATS
ncbi:MAG: hypothetical protein QOJ99_979 [Bryobacterales bacterium]|jgi:L-amino acid N-acyltransferase YncA|nr:hypothetical protein [Bryobacterales bacterium]